MQEDLVSKLAQFGLTINQAKVYLSIIQNGSVTVGEIAKISQLHRQDIYKIVPILEKKGLILRTIDKPVLISAIPTEKALNRLLTAEKEKISKKVSQLELNAIEINNEVANHPHKDKATNDEQMLFQLTTDEQVRNKANLTFENVKSTYDLHVNMDFLGAISKVLANRFQQLNKKVQIRMIIEAVKEADVEKATQNFNVNRPIALKIAKPTDTISYYIIDNNELWITLKKKTESGLPGVLWTNDNNMINFFADSFEKDWRKSKFIKLRGQKVEQADIPQLS